VPEAGEIFVDGAVRKRGSYPLRQKMTLQEAIVAAGGMAPYADNEVTVIRTEDGEPKVHTFDVSKLENWGFQVKDQDIITVDSDGLKKVWYGFRFSLFGVGYEDPED